VFSVSVMSFFVISFGNSNITILYDLFVFYYFYIQYAFFWGGGGARGSVDGSGTMKLAERSRIQISMRSLNLFSVYLIIPNALWS
jgi:hypothetical protein